MAIRAYPTGRSTVFTASGSLSLHYCGGRLVTETVGGTHGNAAIYVGSNFCRPVADATGAPLGDPGHGVMAKAFSGALINTYHGVGGPDDQVWWWTVVRAGNVTAPEAGALPSGGAVAHWWRADEAPETVSVAFSSTFSANEWVSEDDAPGLGGSDDIRPDSPYSPRMKFGWAPFGSVTTTVTGDASIIVHAPVSEAFSPAYYDPDFGRLILWDKETFSYEAYGAFDQWYRPGTVELYPLGPAEGTGKPALPWPDAVYARVSGMDLDGPLPHWTYQRFDNPGPVWPIEHPSSLRSQTFTSIGPGTGYLEVTGEHGWDLAVDGTARDWNGTLYNLPIAFEEREGFTPVTADFTASRTLDVQPEFIRVHAPAPPYSATDTASARLRYGDPWTGLHVDHLPTLRAEDFTTRDLPYGWHATDCGINAVGLPLEGEGLGSGSPTLRKTLKSDFEDAIADPEGWWDANGSDLPTDVQDWWATTGVPWETPRVGDAYKIGRKLTDGSDVFNWSAYRYADLTAKADADCEAGLTIDWDEIVFVSTSDKPSPNTESIRTPRSARFPLPLSATEQAFRLDLPSRCGHDGLRYVRRLTIDFPNDRTVTFYSLDLLTLGTPTVEVHAPTGDVSEITGIVDGKHGLFLSPRYQGFPNSLWGWPTVRFLGVDPAQEAACVTLSELAVEIGLQEGWTASEGSRPAHGTPNSAAHLSEAFARPTPASLGCRRSFGEARIYAHYRAYGLPIALEVNLGSGIHPLTYDPDTGVPVGVPVEADAPDGTPLDGAVTDARGIGRLEVTREGEVLVTAGRGTADESTSGDPLLNRTLYFPVLTAKPAASGTGPLVIDIDRSGNAWLTHVTDNEVRVERRLAAYQTDAMPAFQSFPIGAVGSDPWVHVDETSRDMRVNVVFRWGADTLYQASSAANGTGDWRLLMIGTGLRPFLRKDKSSGITFYLYWRGGTVYLKRSPDDGLTFLEAEITVLTSAVEATYTLDFRLDPSHTIEMPYSDGTDIHSRISVDNGATWSTA